MMSELMKIQKEMWKDNSEGVMSTRGILVEFIKRCKKENIYFESFNQNDCQDFLNNLIDFFTWVN